ncbi:MAG: DUF4173 domain-containing protein [Oscillospiraceae bacterium]|nr:DUF4173 domain-containing protein [Oscillospiraceae bacterium]
MDEKQMEFQNPTPIYPVGKWEWIFGLACLVCALCLSNFVLFGGFYLGFALAAMLILAVTTAYLLCKGHRLTPYTGTLLALSVVIALGFMRSNDGFVKFVLLVFLLIAGNLAFCLLTRQNKRHPGRFSSLLDGPRVVFTLALGQMPQALRGLKVAAKNSGRAGKVGGGLIAGIAIAVPLLAVVITLLVRSDAAFEGLVQLLPEVRFQEILATLVFGVLAAMVLYSRGAALHYTPRKVPAAKPQKGVYALTVNTVLIALDLVYLVYLFSQLAYFTGGLAGILPAGFTMAEYARRGFFEMAWLCAINLAVVAIAAGITARKGEKLPLVTRLACLFISLVTLFFVVSASAKMGMYIASYGLTRLRLLTEVIMIFLGITTGLVAVWLFAPRFDYMKAVVIVGLVMGAVVLWADVDTVVAAYNVSAWENGLLKSVDVGYLSGLSDGALPYIARLAESGNTLAQGALTDLEPELWTDFRDWNIASWITQKMLFGG